MNARQMKKGLKKKIDRLQRDNVLLKDIIVNYPDMKRLYDLYNESPKNVIHTTMRFKEVRANRMMPPYMKDIKGIEEHIKEAVAKDLFEDIKGSIAYKVDTEHIRASIFVGEREGRREI